MALLSGCCVHKWGHKLQSIQGLKKLICFFLCGIINSYSREEASTSETPEVADACGSTASSGSTAATWMQKCILRGPIFKKLQGGRRPSRLHPKVFYLARVVLSPPTPEIL